MGRNREKKPLTEKQELVRSRLVEQGKSIAEIAEEMGVGEGTVYNHRRKVIDAGYSIAPDFAALVPPVVPKIPPQSDLPHLTNGHHSHGYEIVVHELKEGLEAETVDLAALEQARVAAVGEVERLNDEIERVQKRIESLSAVYGHIDEGLVDKSVAVAEVAA